NKQGQTRFSRYYLGMPIQAEERVLMEADIARKCLKRSDVQCSIFEYGQYKLAYRRYASLFFVIGFDEEENHLSILELVQAYVGKLIFFLTAYINLYGVNDPNCLIEILNTYFDNVCELDIMFNIEKVQVILEEMVSNGRIVETNKHNVLAPVLEMNKASR
ncbi:26130_t:CDS:2, partial [Gigaspora rosea]